MLAAEEHALDVDRHDLLPLLDRLGLEGGGKRAGNTGIVDQAVELALARQDLVDDPLPVAFFRSVLLGKARAATDLLHGLEPARLVHVGHDDGRTLLGEKRSRGAADARSRARHQHDLVRYPTHAFLPRTFLSQG